MKVAVVKRVPFAALMQNDQSIAAGYVRVDLTKHPAWGRIMHVGLDMVDELDSTSGTFSVLLADGNQRKFTVPVMDCKLKIYRDYKVAPYWAVQLVWNAEDMQGVDVLYAADKENAL